MSDWDDFDSIGRNLNPGEKLLWSENAAVGIRVTSEDAIRAVLTVLLLLLSTGFLALEREIHLDEFILFGVPFGMAGTLMWCGWLRLDAKQRSQTTYALTDQRVLIVSRKQPQSIKSVPLVTLPEFSLVQDRDGGGEIILGHDNPNTRYAPRWLGYQPTPRLVLATKAREVFELIRKAQADS